MVEPITENYSKLKGSRTTAPKEILPSNPNPNLNSNWGQFSLEVIIRTPSQRVDFYKAYVFSQMVFVLSFSVSRKMPLRKILPG